MAGFFHKGILLQQRKEPALSRDLHDFINADTMGLRIDYPPVAELGKLGHREIIKIARLAKIVDERDGELLANKLVMARKQNAHLVIVDAVDDEPYISSQLNPLLKNLEMAEQGLIFCQRACGAKQAYFTVYKNLTNLDLRIPHRIGNFTVMHLHGRYPAEYQASQNTDKEDALVVGSGAILHLARAILLQKPQTTTFITVAGDCVGTSANLEVSLGMTVTQVLERCGLIDTPDRIVVGGSMTGISVIDTDQTLITPTTRAVLAFRQNIKTLGLSCIGCARCTHVCPQGLNPYYLYRSITQNRFDAFYKMDAQMCIGCGTCSYMCPAKIDLSAAISAGVSSRSHVISIHKTAYLDRKRDKADYMRFINDYLLGKEIFEHKMVRLKMTYRLRKLCKDAFASYQASQRQGKLELQQAQQIFFQAVHQAQAGTVAAKHMLDEIVLEAERMDAMQRNVMEKMEKDVELELVQIQIAANAAEASARQNVLAVLKEQKRFADTIVRVTNAKAKRLEAKAPPEDLIEVRRERDLILKQAESRRVESCIRAQNSASCAVDHARETLYHATTFCHNKLENQKDAYAKAQQAVQLQKIEAANQYAQAKIIQAQEQDQAQIQMTQTKEAILAKMHEGSKVLSKAITENAAELIEELRQSDIALDAARERALASALSSAQADAAVTGRAMRAQDFRPPIRLQSCERERLLGHRLLALETVALPKQQAEQRARDHLLTWVRSHGLQDQAATQDRSGEEVLV